MATVITISDSGIVRCLHNDALPLAELGRQSVTRASRVEFDADRQDWTVTFTGETDPVFRNPSRAACLAWEVATLNQRLLSA